MKFFLDGKEEDIDLSKFKSVKDIFNYFKDKLIQGNVMICKIEVDGKEKKPDEILTLSPSDVQTVKLYTKPKGQLLNDALKEIMVNLPGLAGDLNSVIASFRKGDNNKALEDYLRILPLINTIILGLRSVEIGWGEDFSLDYPNLIDCLKNINEAYENKDYVSLADSLEYALFPWLKDMSQAVLPRIKK